VARNRRRRRPNHIGVVVAYVLTTRDSSWYYSFVSQGMAGGRDPAAATDDLRKTLFSGAAPSFRFCHLPVHHNAQIALFAFALGFAFCLPGVSRSLQRHDAGRDDGAVRVARARDGIRRLGFHSRHDRAVRDRARRRAGFRLGWTLAFPGAQSRIDAMAAAGRKAAIIMTGVVVMLGVAGLLEGIARQVLTDTSLRYAIALFAILYGRPISICREGSQA